MRTKRARCDLAAAGRDEVGALRCYLSSMFDTVDIWYALPDAIRNPELLEGYKGLLSDDETARYERFWFDRDRQLHLVAWALVRTTLSRYADVSPDGWEFRTNRYGRPEIVGPTGTPALRFNLSHTRGLIACIVATELDVGIDVEDRRRDTQGPEIARRYFSDREVAAFKEVSLVVARHALGFFGHLRGSFVLARFSARCQRRSTRARRSGRPAATRR